MVDDERLPMTHLAIYKNGRRLYEHVEGFQSVEDRVPATTSTIYRMYSMTKPIVSAAIMILLEEGSCNCQTLCIYIWVSDGKRKT